MIAVRPTHGRIERHYFKRFATAYPLPDGQIEFGDRPDVILRASRTIGIEITRLFSADGQAPASEQRQRQLRRSVITRAEAEYRRRRAVPRIVSVGFEVIGAGRSQSLARDLAAFVAGLGEKATGEIGRSAFAAALPEVSFLYLVPVPDGAAGWRESKVHSPGLTDPDRLLAAVAEKEAKAGGYEPCDAYWLLVVADAMDPAQEQEIRLDSWTPWRSGVYERGFLFEPLFGRVVSILEP